MVKATWGTKRSCPKCATRFYDMTKDDPVTCIECGYSWTPDDVLKTKQILEMGQAAAAGASTETSGDALDIDSDLDIDVDDDENSPDNEVDLNDGSDIGVIASSDDDDKEDT